MRYWSVPPLLALLCVLAGFATLRAADDPGALFLQAYQSYKNAERLEADGRTGEALQKYRFCASLLEQVQKNSPDYEPIVIDFRLKKSREGIARAQSSIPAAPAEKIGTTPAMANIPPPPASPRAVPPTPVLRFPQLSTAYRLPVPGMPASERSDLPVSERGNFGDSTDRIIERGIVTALKDQIRGLQLRLDQEKRTTADLNLKLLESTAREQMALTEVDRTKVQNVELKGQLEQASRSLDDVQQNGDRVAAEKVASDRRIASLESELEAARADLEVANEYNGELFTKLERASKFIDSSEKIRLQLLAERKELSGRGGEKAENLSKLKRERDEAVAKSETLRKKAAEAEKLALQNRELTSRFASAEQEILDIAKDRSAREKTESSLREEIARLQQERDSATTKNDSLQQQASAAAKLEEQSKLLATKLAAAEQQVAAAAEREKLASGLRQEVDSVNRSLAAMREQLAAGGKRVVELEKQLSETASATAAATGAMAEENALLKSLVTRQLSEQARRQQARKLVEEEMEKLQIRSKTLVQKLNAMGDAETELSPRERKLFEQPMVSAGSGADFSIVIAKKEPASDLPEDLGKRAREANQLAQQGRLAESREIYADVARKAPQSSFAAVNLGITERLLGNYPQAIDAFKHALELKAGDPFILTNLGGAQFRGGDVTASIETLRRAVSADSGSYLAHYLLALALNQSGDAQGARREVDRALDLKPDYLPAVQLGSELGRQSAAEHPPVGGAAPAN